MAKPIRKWCDFMKWNTACIKLVFSFKINPAAYYNRRKRTMSLDHGFNPEQHEEIRLSYEQKLDQIEASLDSCLKIVMALIRERSEIKEKMKK